MLTLHALPPMDELRALKGRYSAEEWLEYAQLFPTLIRLQERPDLALVQLLGTYLPPHERLMIWQAHRGAGHNVCVGSRGTSKSSTWCGLYPLYMGVAFGRRLSLLLSMVGFRGGQLVFEDVERLLEGGWDSQRQLDPFFHACATNRPRPVKRAANFWTLPFDSFSKYTAVPTKDEQNVRGIRTHDAYFDEANLLVKDFIDRVALPFLNVKGDMRHGGEFAHANRAFFVSTIDYGWRPFQERITAARDGIRRDFEARRHMLAGRWGQVAELERAGLHQHTYSRYDYTDILIREELVTRDGRVLRMRYPDAEMPLKQDARGIPYIKRGPDGEMLKDSGPQSYWMTYSMDKQGMERGIFDGSAEVTTWASEQRNVEDTAIGDVYQNDLVDEASCFGSHCIVPYGRASEAYKDKFAGERDDYVAPLLWECEDPCVLGVDYAPSKDFCAFVVIRMGPLAGATRANPGGAEFYDYLSHHGRTRWSNVIWAEQHLKMSGREMGNKIRALRKRYALTWFNDRGQEDHWKQARAIGLDMRGGGHTVRDDLLWLNPEDGPPPDGYRIYDPLDKDDKVLAFEKDERCLPMLDAIHASDETNDTLVQFTVAQMQQRFLFLGTYLDPLARPPRRPELHVGYDTMRLLERQLRKLRQAPTKNWRTFYMDGDTKLHENKRDLWAAFIYAGKQLRAHLIRQSQIDDTPPPLAYKVVRVNSRKGQRDRAPGSKAY